MVTSAGLMFGPQYDNVRAIATNLLGAHTTTHLAPPRPPPNPVQTPCARPGLTTSTLLCCHAQDTRTRSYALGRVERVIAFWSYFPFLFFSGGGFIQTAVWCNKRNVLTVMWVGTTWSMMIMLHNVSPNNMSFAWYGMVWHAGANPGDGRADGKKKKRGSNKNPSPMDFFSTKSKNSW